MYVSDRDSKGMKTLEETDINGKKSKGVVHESILNQSVIDYNKNKKL